MAELYGLNPLLSGLLYLPSGIGGLIASLQTGRLLDYHYKVVARSLEASPPPSVFSDLSPTTLPTHDPPVSVSRSQFNDLYAFPNERARLRAMAPFLLISPLHPRLRLVIALQDPYCGSFAPAIAIWQYSSCCVRDHWHLAH